MAKRTASEGEQTRGTNYVGHVQHLARRAGSPRNKARYTRKAKHKGRDDA